MTKDTPAGGSPSTKPEFPSGPDMILEDNILLRLTGYLKAGGSPYDAIHSLTSTFVNISELCDVLSDLVSDLNIAEEVVCEKELRDGLQNEMKQLLNNWFCPIKADELFLQYEVSLLNDINEREIYIVRERFYLFILFTGVS
jgi:hypothetical protein